MLKNLEIAQDEPDAKVVMLREIRQIWLRLSSLLSSLPDL
jgi:hypothetical protein